MAVQNNNNVLAQVLPKLTVDPITDIYIKKNFQALADYFGAQNQLLNFNFFEQVFTEAQSNVKVAHGLSYVPLDVIVTRMTGDGAVTFNHGLFDKENMDLTVSGACRVRWFAGSYWNQTPTVQPAADETTQFAASFSNLFSTFEATLSLVPTGTIFSFGGDVVPMGYLLCDGRTFLRSAYPALFSAIGVAWGTADTKSFNIPDLRGRFVRGTNSSTGRDPDAAARTASATGGNTGDKVASVQTDAFQGHRHVSAPWTQTLQIGTNPVTGNGTAGAPTDIWAQAPSTDGTHGTPRISNETRPVNVNVNFIIKT